MGQRLNIEIHKDGQVLANAYYHWSGFTSSSLELLKAIVLEGIPTVGHPDNNILYAVWLLQTTGAGVPDNKRTSDRCKDFYALTPFHDRNEGVISVEDKDVAETRYWEEARINIDIGTKTFDFDCFSIIDKIDYESDFAECGCPKFDTLPTVHFDFNGIPFDKFDDFLQLMEEIESFKSGYFRVCGSDEIYCVIE